MTCSLMSSKESLHTTPLKSDPPYVQDVRLSARIGDDLLPKIARAEATLEMPEHMAASFYNIETDLYDTLLFLYDGRRIGICRGASRDPHDALVADRVRNLYTAFLVATGQGDA